GHCVELIQTRSTVLTPGQSLTLTCKVSGYSLTDSSYCTAWIRKPAGKTLEWIGHMYSYCTNWIRHATGKAMQCIGHICSGGGTGSTDSLKNRFSITQDTSSNTVTLNGQNVQMEDTAVYYYSYGQSLTSSASVVKRPGESVTVSCTVSGFSMSSHWMHWIRQKPGRGVEWIGGIDGGTGTDFAQSLQGQFSITKDTNKNMLYLEVKSLKAEDTAVYYCARDSH
ncbi:hypothetical protein HF521_005013, partial [Silurus meridionalis]